MNALTSMPDICAKSKRNVGHKEQHMTAIVFPFPILRRHGFIRKQSSHAALMNPDSGVRYLQHQIDVQAETMRRRGINEDLIQRELHCMRRALQAEFSGNIMQPER
jgi:hypothetical protein